MHMGGGGGGGGGYGHGGGGGYGHGGGGYGHSGGGHHASHSGSGHHHGGEPSQSPSWNMAMQADPYWATLLKANQKPLVVVVAVTFGMVGWLTFIQYVHHRDEPNHVISRSDWDQQLTAADPRASAGQQATQPDSAPFSSQSAVTGQTPAAFGAPEAFGSPGPAYNPQAEAAAAPINNRTYSNRTPSLAPLMFSHFMPGGYSPAQSPSQPLSMMGSPSQPSGFAMPQQVMPTRVHSAERFKVVVSR
jgi:hypothetical protein